MANNRLFITCGRCDSRLMLFKYFPEAGYIKEGAEEWLKVHSDDCGEPNMSLVWENDAEFDGRYQDGHPLGKDEKRATS